MSVGLVEVEWSEAAWKVEKDEKHVKKRNEMVKMASRRETVDVKEMTVMMTTGSAPRLRERRLLMIGL